ncbi:MAG: hypothetical protein ACJAZ0_003043 [Halioglobus sp.]|jgi:hypothetical protein
MTLRIWLKFYSLSECLAVERLALRRPPTSSLDVTALRLLLVPRQGPSSASFVASVA